MTLTKICLAGVGGLAVLAIGTDLRSLEQTDLLEGDARDAVLTRAARMDDLYAISAVTIETRTKLSTLAPLQDILFRL